MTDYRKGIQPLHRETQGSRLKLMTFGQLQVNMVPPNELVESHSVFATTCKSHVTKMWTQWNAALRNTERFTFVE